MTPTTNQHLARTIQQDRVAEALRDRFAGSVADAAESSRHALSAWRLVTAIVGLRDRGVLEGRPPPTQES